MTQRMVVGICGPKFSGKDTCAAVLVRDYGFVVKSFASFLKEGCRAIFGLSDAQLYGDEKETVDPRWNVTPRAILQAVGTDLFRNQLAAVLPDLGASLASETLWCRCMRLYLNELPPGVRVVIPDVRFPDEVDLVRSFGGHLVRVHRPSLVSTDLHVSETLQATLQADVSICNSGTIQDLDAEVASGMSQLFPDMI